MRNFSIFTQVEKELKDFFNSKVQIAVPRQDQSVRQLTNKAKGYWYNQGETITLVDLYYSSQFEDGDKDRLGQRKLFLNVGKFRADVASKQIDLDFKDFRFTPDDFSDPYTAILMQKEFKDWAKCTYFSEELNESVENLPKYGTIVAKKCGDELHLVPLQTLRNEQTAECLDEADYVIEEHADMPMHELQEKEETAGWDLTGLKMRYGEKITIYERYGHVPLGWLKKQKGETPNEEDWDISVDAMCIVATKVPTADSMKTGHIFFVEQIDERPYREAHWSRQHGRWLGIGEIENQFANQIAKNIIINILRRSLHWSSKRVFKTKTADMLAKNLVRDVKDGDVLEVGANGDIEQIDLSYRGGNDSALFLQEFERNSDQKSFTYEVATGAALPSGTPFRLGVVLSNSVNSHFALKREKLGLFWRSAIVDFMVPQFIDEMDSKERIIAFASGDPGYNIMMDVAEQYIKAMASKLTLLNGQPVDAETLATVVAPFKALQRIPFELKKNNYKDVKCRIDLDPTGESTNLEAKIATLTTQYQLLMQTGDPRAERVLERLGMLSGEPLSQFGPAPSAKPPAPVMAPPGAPQPSSMPSPQAAGMTAVNG